MVDEVVCVCWWTVKWYVRDSCGGDDDVVDDEVFCGDSCGGDEDVVCVLVDDEVVCAGQLRW